ncbi:MAG: tRNA pseudouridine(38-40) synthase TruA [Puniceicoccales bacterium]|jgi:tRNA pseudouridine38-40 synthase|nr:tRNA pseudouridine(38-40) synthase TruA [Puniceicoccales bacterium]
MRWKGTCAYDGTRFDGWQSQSSRNGVQDVIEHQLQRIFKRPIRIHGSSRTDAGVHAEEQVFHFDADWPHGSDILKKAVSSGLPSDLQVLHIEPISEVFHARYSALKKRYRYDIRLGPSDPFESRYVWSLNPRRLSHFENLQECARAFVGTHNFSAFAGKIYPREKTLKTLYRLEVETDKNRIRIHTEGNGYLYRMVRILVGVLVEAGQGRWSPETLSLRLKNGPPRVPTTPAPAHGLFLEKIIY